MKTKNRSLIFSSNRRHLLDNLLGLEFVVLVLYVCLYYYLNFYNFELYFIVFFMNPAVSKQLMIGRKREEEDGTNM